MTKLSCCAVAVALSCAGFAPRMEAQQQAVNPDAKVLVDYKERIDGYMKLHTRLEKQSPPLKPTENPAEIRASQEGLAEKIREARAEAKQGEIFTPEVSKLFRRLLSPPTKGPDGAQTQEAIKEDAPAKIPLKVNATYPEEQPLPTVPPNVLASLPQLPEDLEYRVVHNHLILRDVPANLIVDFIPNAIR